MVMKRIVEAVSRELPEFNDGLIKGIRKGEVDNLIDFIIDRYEECIEVIGEDVELLKHEIVPPIERLKFELESNRKMNLINIKDDEAILVRFTFRHGTNTFSKLLYVPYLFENSSIVINSVRYECLLSMSEKIFSVRKDNGITIKVIRSPISFWKNTMFSYSDVVTNDLFVTTLITCKIHYKKTSKSKKKIKPTIIHYLLCKFTLGEVLEMFGIGRDEVIFTKTIGDDTDTHHYFKAQNIALKKNPILLKVSREAMKDKSLQCIIGSIVYLLGSFRPDNFESLITNSQTDFMIKLGKLIYNTNLNSFSSLNYMEKHIASVDTYLDAYSKGIFSSNGIMADNIYELMCYVFVNIDQIIMEHPNNNMYNKRLDTVHGVIIDNLLSSLYYKIYAPDKKKNKNYMEEIVSRSLDVIPRFILKRMSDSDNVRFNANVYNDNWLLSIGAKMVKRLSATKKSRNASAQKRSHGNEINAPANKFHPSMIIVESAVGFGSRPGSNALINPYAEIDDYGGFKLNKVTEKANDILQYLPK